MRKILFWGTGVSLSLIPALVWASAGGSEAAAHPGMPVSYIVVWVILLFVLAVAWMAYKKAPPVSEHLGEEHISERKRGHFIPWLLVIAVSFLFLLESYSAVASYHEPLRWGMLRLFIKLGAGVLLMIYGLSFMREHNQH